MAALWEQWFKASRGGKVKGGGENRKNRKKNKKNRKQTEPAEGE
jgi:hypothetical protein